MQQQQLQFDEQKPIEQIFQSMTPVALQRYLDSVNHAINTVDKKTGKHNTPWMLLVWNSGRELAEKILKEKTI